MLKISNKVFSVFVIFFLWVVHTFLIFLFLLVFNLYCIIILFYLFSLIFLKINLSTHFQWNTYVKISANKIPFDRDLKLEKIVKNHNLLRDNFWTAKPYFVVVSFTENNCFQNITLSNNLFILNKISYNIVKLIKTKKKKKKTNSLCDSSCII